MTPRFNFEAGPSGGQNARCSCGHESSEAEAEFGHGGYDHRYGHPYGQGRFGFGFRRPFGFHGGRDFGGWRGRGFNRRWPWMYRSAPGVSVFAGQSADPRVAQAQQCLAQILGTWVPQDGRMNSATQQAIQTFQTQQQLPVTGTLDDNTLAAIQSACSAQTGGSAGSQQPQSSEY